jgi:dihydrofolate synthase/folylpolyglutamate synthase
MRAGAGDGLSELTYAEIVAELFPRLTGSVRWGLGRTERLLAAVGDPHRSFHSLHVGGTNGKGSVSATLASVLRGSGHRVGLYTSPHLCSFRERIQIAGEPVSEEALVRAARRLWPAIQAEGASFFEATTALAFLIFADAGVDVAVVEVGLGGRLDSTNVLTPDVVVLTNVALDHTESLGETRAAIAREKAGIIKPGVPVLTGEGEGEALEVFRARAHEVGARLYDFDPTALGAVEVGSDGTRFTLRTRRWGALSLHTPLIGAHQARNTALAVEALEHLPEAFVPEREALVRGVAEVRWPGRLQWEQRGGQSWIFDVAHNPAGVEALVAALEKLSVPRPVVAVVGILSDKDWAAMLPALLGLADRLILTIPPTAPPGRRWDPAGALALLPEGRGVVVEDFDAALEVARREAGEGAVVVTGSFHTVGDALTRLGLAPWGSDAPLPHPGRNV